VKDMKNKLYIEIITKPFKYIVLAAAILFLINFVYPDSYKFAFAIFAFLFTSLVFIYTNAEYWLKIRDRVLKESEKRLKKFYGPTNRILENIQRSNFDITGKEDNIIEELENIVQYKYLAKNDTKKSFLEVKAAFLECVSSKKTCLDPKDKDIVNTLFCCIKRDINFYEALIEDELESLE
jgi:glucan phosphoethanolaminetransferase (alkaline phosphatase superfamily)